MPTLARVEFTYGKGLANGRGKNGLPPPPPGTTSQGKFHLDV